MREDAYKVYPARCRPELRAFWAIEERYATAIRAYRKAIEEQVPQEPQQAANAIQDMLAWTRCMANWPDIGATYVAAAAEKARR